ncbi:MAG: hypothetical protein C5S40_03005 [ANME-2 cluster archaeon]|nr:hypothetical protein [ANME-2 cluster archaeon]
MLHLVHRPHTLPDRPAFKNSPGNKQLGTRSRIPQTCPASKEYGQCRRIGAPCPMGPAPDQFAVHKRKIHTIIQQVSTLQVPPCDYYSICSRIHNPACRFLCIIQIIDPDTGEYPCLIDIGCQYPGQRDEFFLQCYNSLAPDQAVSSLGRHDRVNHQRDLVLPDHLCHPGDNTRRGEHTCLGISDLHVSYHRPYLGFNSTGRQIMYILHACGVLGSDRSNCTRTVCPQCCKGLQVSLYTCTAA